MMFPLTIGATVLYREMPPPFALLTRLSAIKFFIIWTPAPPTTPIPPPPVPPLQPN